MKKRKAIIKLSFILAAVVIGILLAVVRIPFGVNDFKSFAGSIRLGIDLKGGVYAVYDVADDENLDNIDARLDGTVTRIKSLLASQGGFTEATVVRESTTRIRVEVPNVQDPEAIFKIIGEPAKLEFVLEGNTIFTGDNVIDASAQYSQDNGGYGVSLVLDSAGSSAMFAATSSENKGKTISIVVNGNTISNATINEPIPNGRAFISGDFTLETAESLAGQILAGAMDVKLSLLESDTVSATLGQAALMYGLIAGGIALILIFAFLGWFYRLLGGAANLSLLIYMVLLLFLLAVLPWVQLTLPGIAGVILSIGMAVDANVIIFERIKEEYRTGKSISSSVHAGFKRALSAIVDSNVTTIIAAIVLWILGSGPVQGFAITLFVGVIISMFTALVVTRGVLKYLLDINKISPELYNLRRDGNVIETPDEPEQQKQNIKKEKALKKGDLSYAE